MSLIMGLVRNLTNLIESHDPNYKNWYVGITDDINRRSSEHNITNEKAGYVDAISKENAQTIETHLLSLGCRGGTGGGNSLSKYVYVYHISQSTNE